MRRRWHNRFWLFGHDGIWIEWNAGEEKKHGDVALRRDTILYHGWVSGHNTSTIQIGVLWVGDVIARGIHDRIQSIVLRKAYGSKKLVYA